MRTTTQAQGGRDRAREARLTAAHERRIQLDPGRLARDQRIDQAVVDVEIAWEARGKAEQSIADAETAAAALERLLVEGLPVKAVAALVGMDITTIRRLRRLTSDGRRDAGREDARSH